MSIKIPNNKVFAVYLAVSSLFATPNAVGDEQSPVFTLEKIMSDPSWIGRSPQNGKWLSDSSGVVFQQQNETAINDTRYVNTENIKQEDVLVEQAHLFNESGVVFNNDRTVSAYVFNGDIFLRQLDSGQVSQLTASSEVESKLRFLTENRLGFWRGNRLFAFDLATNLISELANLKMSDQPKPPKEPEDIIAQEQHELIEYVAKQQQKKLEKYQYGVELRQNNPAVGNRTFYLGKGQQVVRAEVSPTGNHIFVVAAKTVPWRGDNDLMPNYIGQDGRIQFEQVRRRVSDARPNQQNYWLLDLTTTQKSRLNIKDLPDHDKDVLKLVKKENAKEQGEEYKSEAKARTINLINDWTWSQSPIQWNNDGDQVAIMLEAWDNKDRWIATVDFEEHRFVTQHQLHDEAWINYTFNDFGWFNNKDTLYWLSEQSGYSHLYTKSISSKRVKQITAGRYEVSTPYLTRDDKHFYFRANVSHPGDYQVYKVASNKKRVKKPKSLTSQRGNLSFKVSPDESSLLVTHSTNTTPPELYTLDMASGNLSQLTNTVSEEFKEMPWQQPEVVAVPSSHTDQPIYAKVYYPKDYQQGEPRRAVIFNHGAGYLQNSDYGWSGYFREFMFHNLLAEQGYVVMDMDYRASQGYGRDWRTAIYRQMGTPEVQDLQDGVEWLVNNANVDRGRIGTYGGSYGGFMTFMALFTQPDLFQAGAALRPVSDWAHYNDGYTSNILNRPQDDMIAYRRSSPIYFAEGLQKPLLINAPMIDNNVFFLDVVRLVQRLIELEKQDFETAIYPVEPHGFVQPSSWLDEYRRIYKLFETHL